MLDYFWAIVAARHKLCKMIDQPLKSYKELIDCCCPKEKKVYPYNYQYAFDYIKTDGLRVMSQYEFTGVKGNCKPKSTFRGYKKAIYFLYYYYYYFVLSLFFYYYYFIYFIILFFQKQQAIYADKDKPIDQLKPLQHDIYSINSGNIKVKVQFQV